MAADLRGAGAALRKAILPIADLRGRTVRPTWLRAMPPARVITARRRAYPESSGMLRTDRTENAGWSAVLCEFS